MMAMWASQNPGYPKTCPEGVVAKLPTTLDNADVIFITACGATGVRSLEPPCAAYMSEAKTKSVAALTAIRDLQKIQAPILPLLINEKMFPSLKDEDYGKTWTCDRADYAGGKLLGNGTIADATTQCGKSWKSDNSYLCWTDNFSLALNKKPVKVKGEDGWTNGEGGWISCYSPMKLVTACTADANCTTNPSTKACISGACRLPLVTACKIDKDCATNPSTISCVGETCRLPLVTSCTSDSNCTTNLNTTVCHSGACTTPAAQLAAGKVGGATALGGSILAGVIAIAVYFA